MAVSKDESMRIRWDADEKKRLDELWQAKKVSQQEAVVQVLRWFARQDDLFQSIILGQIRPDSVPDVARIVLERMAHDHPSDAQTTSGRPPVPRLVARSAKKTGENQ